MKKCKITVLKTTLDKELAEEYGVPGLGACPMMREGQVFYADYAKPEGFCDEAWKAVYQYVFALSHGAGEGLFYYGDWIRKPETAICSCNDGLRPVIFKIEVTEEEVAFPWFTLTGVDGEAAAYAQFITALCQMASEQTRILDKPYDGDNDRFAMRIFMVRLGMKGAAFALARKLMMKHLTGNSGWRYGAPPKGKAETTEKEETNVCD